MVFLAISVFLAVRIPIPRQLQGPFLIFGGIVLGLAVLFLVAARLTPDGSPLRMIVIAALLLGGIGLIGFTLLEDGFSNSFYRSCRDEDAEAELRGRAQKRPSKPEPLVGTRPGDKVNLTCFVGSTKRAQSINGMFRTKDFRVDLRVENPPKTFERLACKSSDRPWGTTIEVKPGSEPQTVIVQLEVSLPTDETLLGTEGMLEVSGRVEYPVLSPAGDIGGLVREKGFAIESGVLADQSRTGFLSRAALDKHAAAVADYQRALQAWEARDAELDHERKVLDGEALARFSRLKWAFRIGGILCLGGIGVLYWRSQRGRKPVA